jgi:hypothetical protein
VADPVKTRVENPGEVGRGSSFFDPLAFGAVTEPRFGAAGLSIPRGAADKVQSRAEAFNVTNTPHFGNPGASVLSMILNADGSIRSLGGYTEATNARDERQFRFALRISF